MESALIVTSSEKGTAFFTEMLSMASIAEIATLRTCAEARRLLMERDFDLIIINSPLRDESGESLARHAAAKGISQVILVVKSEYFEAVSAQTEEYGVLTVAKPINRSIFWSALKLAKAANVKLKQMRAENTKLEQKLEDIRVIDRAKCILISYLGMTEKEAHRYIEKRAMDMRVTRKVVAESILRTYEN